MESKSIILPMCGQALVTLMVWIWLYVTRVSTIKKKRVHPQELANATRSDQILKEVVNPSDNFENLFELPVLFFVALLILLEMHLADSLYVFAAWAFVILRLFHSLIHCSYNRIMHRFYTYIGSSLVLWAIWIRLTFQIIGMS